MVVNEGLRKMLMIVLNQNSTKFKADFWTNHLSFILALCWVLKFVTYADQPQD